MKHFSKVFDTLSNLNNYIPPIFLTTQEIVAASRRTLRQAIGKPLTASWVGWNDRNNSWCEALPVILEIGGNRCEICWQKEAECALSQDLINTQEPFFCYGLEELPGVWKESALPELRQVLGQVLTGMELIEAEVTISSERFFNKYWVPNGLLFKFGKEALYVSNGFDQNSVAAEPPPGEEFRRSLILAS